ncbi:haloacid dehalogenase type II [Bacillus daqingensis]|uniref:Haloacid dehalogenase type II n=1 Tax=Bacillus daqingensis TaxID=872396 RepID=A0ABV9NV73_9BACI
MKYSTIMYDAYGTLFDLRSVEGALSEYYPQQSASIGQLWRKKQIEYAFTVQMSGSYRPFSVITEEALRTALHAETGSTAADAVNRGMRAYEKLSLFPESAPVLQQLNGPLHMIVSNGSRDMLEPLIEQSAVAPEIDRIVSVDDIKQYKPSSAAYYHAMREAGVSRSSILFVSSNTWDIIGAKTFGFDTLWISRDKAAFESVPVQPDYIAEDLHFLTELFAD